MGIYRPVNEPEIQQIRDGLILAAHLAVAEQPLGSEDLQPLYDAFVGQAAQNPRAVEALGYAFGQLFLENDWLDWAMLSDEEYGDEISIAVKDRQLGCSPLSMIRNRLEDAEVWNLRELMETTVKRLRQLGQQATSP
jgi:hypothetical protein